MAARRVRPDLILPTRRALLAGAVAVAAAPRVAYALPQPEGDWAPFDDSFGLIQIKGAINGHPVNLTLDSGAGRVVVDQAFAAQIGLETLDMSGTLHGLSESRPGGRTGPVVIEVGGGSLRLNNAILADLSSLRLVGFDASVLLGRDIFETTAVDIDFVGKRIAFRQPGSFSTAGFRRARLRPRQDMRQIEVAIEDARPAWGTVDLGSASPLAMSETVARSAGLLDGRPGSVWLSSGVDGVTRYNVATASQIRIAGMTFRDVPFDSYPIWNGEAASKINIGYPLLRRFGRIIVDYKSDSLFVGANPPQPEPFGKNRMGLAITDIDGGGYRVVMVAPGSPAARGAWKEGDTIAAINGEARMPAHLRRRLGETARILFTMADGSVRVLFPADYY
jgi:predicted aspartyl protease